MGDKVITLRLPHELLIQLDAAAADAGISRSECMRRCLWGRAPHADSPLRAALVHHFRAVDKVMAMNAIDFEFDPKVIARLVQATEALLLAWRGRQP